MRDVVPNAMKIHSDNTARMAHTLQQTAAVAMKPPEMARIQEAMNLATATVARYQTMQSNWMQAWSDWAAYAGTLDGVDTVPKLMERVGNIGLRAQAQIASQNNDLANLNENVSVSYLYWLSQQLDPD